ncbi:MAG: hypothetical protein WKF57_03315 [Nakamurella sp.]
MTPGGFTRRQGGDVRGATASAAGTFGELLQGVLPDGTDFLVTLPIALRSHATFRLGHGEELVIYPSHKRKAEAVARRMIDAAGHHGGGTLVIDSAIPTGKGLASSSADLVATVRAVGRCLGLAIDPASIENWIRGVEPTDGVMHEGIVAFDHCSVRLRHEISHIPPLAVVAIDEGGRLDTVSFNRVRKPYTADQRSEYAELLQHLTAALHRGDLARVGEISTRSAELAELANPKRTWPALRDAATRTGALGVVTTHSGTMHGLLLDAAAPDHALTLIAAREACAAICRGDDPARSDPARSDLARSDPAARADAGPPPAISRRVTVFRTDTDPGSEA